MKKIKLATASFLFTAACIYTNNANAQTAAPQTDSLAVYRQVIDSLDNQLIMVLGKRMEVSKMIGAYKAKNNLAVLQQSRFDALVKKNVEAGKKLNLSEALIVDIMNAIHKESLANQEAKK